MIQLLSAWFCTCAAILTVGHYLDAWMDDSAKRDLSHKIKLALLPDLLRWVHSVGGAFLNLFDLLYGWTDTALNRCLWHAVIFSYAIFASARLILWSFEIDVPDTQHILGASLYVALACLLLLAGAPLGAFIARKQSGQVAQRQPRVVSYVLSWMLTMALCVVGVSLVLGEIGISVRVVAALALGCALGVPLITLVAMIPTWVHPVNPVRAVASSILFMSVLALLFPDAAMSFFGRLRSGEWLILGFVAFNLFADAVSLVETRWILQRSTTVRFGSLAMLLIADLLLSALIYLVLPALADQDARELLDGIVFRGEKQWIGILFWSTFSTSVLFYLFVVSVVLLKVYEPIAKFFRGMNGRFGTEAHPVRSLALAMMLASTVMFAAIVVFGWF